MNALDQKALEAAVKWPLARVREALPITIYTVEDEQYVVLKVAGVVVAQRLASTAAGIAILKLDAALSAFGDLHDQ